MLGAAIWPGMWADVAQKESGVCQKLAYGPLTHKGQPKAEQDHNRKAARDCANMLVEHLGRLDAKLTGDVVEVSVAGELRALPFAGAQWFATKDNIRRYLMRLHRTYRNLKETLGKEDSEKLDSIREADELVHRLMARYELRERIGTAIDTGVTWAETGNDAVKPARDAKLETKGRGLLRWETEHFGDDSPWGGFLDGSLGGSFGFAPVMTLVGVLDPATNNPVTSGGKPAAYATHYQGFTWDVVGRVQFPGRVNRSEPGAFLRYGHTLLLSDTDSLERSGAESQKTTVVLQRLRNATGRVARFWETGFEARLYEQESMDQIHHEKSYTTPALYAAAGYRNDSRFLPAGDLERTNPHRAFFRLAISFNRLVKGKQEGEKPSKASFQFGVDYERSLSGRVPNSIRFFFGPDLSLLGFTNGK
jgi:hypothetical protein